MQSKRVQLAKALVFSTTVGGIIFGNIALGYWIGGYLQQEGIVSWGRAGGIAAGMITAVWSIYQTLRLDFLNKDNKLSK